MFVKNPGKSPSLMAMYVDDLLMAARKCEAQRELQAISRKPGADEKLTFEIGQSGPLEVFLGVEAKCVKEGTQTKVTLSQHGYCRRLIDAFLRDVNKSHLYRAKIPMAAQLPEAAEFEAPGVLKDVAAKYVGALLRIVRCSRPDCAYAVGHVCRRVHKWSRASDRMLEKIMAYLQETIDYCLTFWINEGEKFNVLTFCDADHGGCEHTARSTTGAVTYLVGQKSQVLTSWISRRQGCAATSTAEAELVAISEAARKMTLPTATTLEDVFEKTVPWCILTDSSAALAAAKSGASAAMRHTRKSHRVSLGVVHDTVSQPGGSLKHVSSEDNVADIMTKPLQVDRFSMLREALGVVANSASACQSVIVAKSAAEAFG